MQVMLDQVGGGILKGRIMDAMFQPGPNIPGSIGEALLWLPDQELAEYVVWHFNGVIYGINCPVSASLVETAPLPEAMGDASLAMAEGLLDVLLEEPVEWPRNAKGDDMEVPMRLVSLLPEEFSISLLPEEFSNLTETGYTESTHPEYASEALEPLSTIWEECKEAEVSTDAGATSGTSVASEAEDSHEDEGATTSSSTDAESSEPQPWALRMRAAVEACITCV